VADRGALRWRHEEGIFNVTLCPGANRTIQATAVLGAASGLGASTFRLLVLFAAATGGGAAPDVSFRQPH
jgi:hypothetical protein